METGLRWLLLVAVLKGVQCQSLKETAEENLIPPGGTLTITCTVSGIDLSSNAISWVRQAPGNGLEWIGGIDNHGTTYYASWAKGRTTITRSTSAGTVTLKMTGLTDADTATYFCASNLDVWGPGTLVTVSSVSLSSPTLYPLVSCEGALSDGNLVAMGCLARDFLPSSVTFSWSFKNSSEISSRTVRTFPVVKTGDKYMATSQVLVPSKDVLQGTDEYLVCKVQHGSSNKDLHVSFPGEPRGLPRDGEGPVWPGGSGGDLGRAELTSRPHTAVDSELPPTVSVFIPPRDSFSGSGTRKSRLICQATGFSPKQISVSWLRDGQKVESGVLTKPVEAETKGAGPATFSISSMLAISESDWLSQNLYTCRVDHRGIFFDKNVSMSSECSTSQSSGIQVFPIAPSFADTFLSKSARLICLVTDLTTYGSLNISWASHNGKALETHMNITESHPNATFSATGEASVCAEDWESGEQFTCTVTHADLPFPLKHTISKSREVAKHPPAVYVLPPAREQLVLRESATVTCLVKGFSPADVFVQWQQRGQPLSSDKYVTSAPAPEPQAPGLYFTHSTLTVTEEDWNSGETFTCVVGHEALPHMVTERTVDKSTGKPTLYNVSLIMSDTASTCY